jgi:hypothetical protein
MVPHFPGIEVHKTLRYGGAQGQSIRLQRAPNLVKSLWVRNKDGGLLLTE